MTVAAPSVEVPVGHFIGGKLLPLQGDLLGVLRPSDRREYAALPIGDADLVDSAVRNAREAFRTSGWATQHPRVRARIMRRWADLIEADAETLGLLEAIGSTRPVSQAIKGDVPYVAETIRFYAEIADKSGGEVAATQSSRLGMIIAEPYGVTAAIVPWNVPLMMTGWKLGPTLAAGNAVVIKPSEMTPFSAVRLAQLAIQAGVPAGILNVIQGNGQITGDALVRHPSVGKVSFTGSTAAGTAIMTASAQSGMKPVTLELGGKSPQVVFADADLDLAARCIVNSITFNAGQVCVAGSRLIVARSVADELLGKIAGGMESIRPAPTWQMDGTYSPVISAQQMARVDGIVQRTVAQGASIFTGGRPFEGCDGAFYRPTILHGVTDDMEGVREEIFGPVLSAQSFDSEEEALTLANHPTYGLAAGIYSRDISRVLRVTRRIEAGTIWVNRYGRSEDMAIPTGGYKQSGIGKDLGRQAYEANLRYKSVLIDIADSAGL